MEKQKKKCAVVGNSGILLKSSYGDLIDSHDYIIRFNLATSKGYEDHVGSKLDLRIVNCHMFNSLMPGFTKENEEIFSEYDPQYVLKIKNENVLIKSNVSTGVHSNTFEVMRENGCNVDKLSPDHLNLLTKMLGAPEGKEPSCGMVGVYLALLQFEEVSCFGFNFYDEPWESKHYYEDMKPYDIHASHSFDYEKKWIEGLEKEGRIKVYR